MDPLNQILFDDKSFSDLLKEIHGNQKKKAKQLASLIAEATVFNKYFLCSYFYCWSHFKAKN